jgi:hypothetical protein
MISSRQLDTFGAATYGEVAAALGPSRVDERKLLSRLELQAAR